MALGKAHLRPTWPLLLRVFVSWAKFLQQSGYYTVTNYTFAFLTVNVFLFFRCVIAHFKLVNHKFPNKPTLLVHLAAFKSRREGNNAQRVSAPNTGILLTTVETWHILKFFGHMINATQTRIYETYSKLLTRPRKYLNFKTIY